MRRMQRIHFHTLSSLLFTVLILAGCTRTISTPLVEKQPQAASTASQVADSGSSAPTPYSEGEHTGSQAPTATISAPQPPEQGPDSTIASPPTLIPTLEADGLADRLSSAFTIQALPGTNEHTLLQISGWEYGYRSSSYCEHGPYRWLDNTHLLLFPNLGQEEGMGIVEWTQPVVINLDGKTWLPPLDGRSDQCRSVEWSPALQALISSQAGNLLVSKVDGELLKNIEGKGHSGFVISPSGEKILAQGTWIDLLNGKEVDFGWDAGNGSPFYPAWAQDEERLFNCCYAYGDASNGEGMQFDLGGLTQVGRGLDPGFNGIESRWVLSDTHSMTLWDFSLGSDQLGIVPLFVPEAQAYVDVRDLTGIPADQYCRLTSVSPDGNLIWIDCGSAASYLIDLRTYEKSRISDERLSAWSADSQFALTGKFVDSEARIGNFELFSSANRQRQELTDTPIHEPVWSPEGHRLAYLSADGQALVQVDTGSMVSQSTPLPTVFNQILWDPGADHLALVAQDGSLWQVEVFGNAQPEQVSSPLPDVRAVHWSPDGRALSLVSGNDLYIVK